MQSDSPVQTAFGEVPLEELRKAYEQKMQYAITKLEWLKTEEGKAYNRKKSKEYYERHKQTILDKRANRYEKDKDTLLNRAKEYYLLHSEEINEKNKQKRKQKKIEIAEA